MNPFSTPRPRRRNAGSDWRETARNARQEEQEKVVADKRKKLIRAIPATIPGVSAVVRGDARSDIREIEALADMQAGGKTCLCAAGGRTGRSRGRLAFPCRSRDVCLCTVPVGRIGNVCRPSEASAYAELSKTEVEGLSCRGMSS